MATRNISLSEDAYEALKNLKTEEESFSDVVERISGKHSDITRLAGSFPEIGDVKEDLEEERKSIRTRDITV